MLIKDQLRVRMDQLQMPVTELARRVGVSGQSVRHWLAGRSFPGKAKTALLEGALSCKLDFSEGTSEHAITVDETLRKADIETFVVMARLPPDVQELFTQLAMRFLSKPQISPEPAWREPELVEPPARRAVVVAAPRRQAVRAGGQK